MAEEGLRWSLGLAACEGLLHSHRSTKNKCFKSSMGFEVFVFNLLQDHAAKAGLTPDNSTAYVAPLIDQIPEPQGWQWHW